MVKEEALEAPKGWERTWAVSARAVDDVNEAAAQDWAELKAAAAAKNAAQGTLGEALGILVRLDPSLSLEEALKRVQEELNG